MEGLPVSHGALHGHDFSLEVHEASALAAVQVPTHAPDVGAAKAGVQSFLSNYLTVGRLPTASSKQSHLGDDFMTRERLCPEH